MSMEGEKGSGRVVTWESGKAGRVVCWKGGRGGKDRRIVLTFSLTTLAPFSAQHLPND